MHWSLNAVEWYFRSSNDDFCFTSGEESINCLRWQSTAGPVRYNYSKINSNYRNAWVWCVLCFSLLSHVSRTLFWFCVLLLFPPVFFRLTFGNYFFMATPAPAFFIERIAVKSCSVIFQSIFHNLWEHNLSSTAFHKQRLSERTTEHRTSSYG